MLFSRFYSSFLCLAHVSASFVADRFVTTNEECSCIGCSSPNYLVSSSVKLGGITYYIPPKPIANGICSPTFTPTTLIKISPSDLPITSTWLNDKIGKFITTDDVFTPDFLASISFVSRASLGRAFSDGDLDLADFYAQWKMTGSVVSVIIWKGEDELFEGPYFLSHEGMKQAWRVYEDPLDAFQVGVVPSFDDPGSFQPLPISITSSTHLSIAVPSRLYSHPPTPEKPLSGLRIGIKDIIDLSGLPTSHQSRAYLTLRGGPLENTASAIQTLINKGAVIVGKTRTTQFAAGEQASGDWIDFLPPWNPRGDGWQVPGMSSAGSASAVAGYEWLDGAVGSDTLGSMTGPAALQGLFGNRISTGVLELDGVMPITKVLDTLGFFARDIKVFNTVLKAWLPETIDENQGHYNLPKTLIYPTDHFPLSPPEVQAPISAFVEKLEAFLRVRKSEISFAEEWKKTASFAKGVDIRDYLKTVVSTLQLKGSWDNSRWFADEYERVFDREMEVHSQVKHKWKLGAQITDEQKEEAERKMREYTQWLDKQFFSDGCGSGLLVLPLWEVGKVMYRNGYRGPPEEVNYIGMGWYEGLEPVLAGLPVVVVPVGQFPYESRMTGRKEWLPVGLAVVAARNCDLMLAELLETFLGEVGMEKVKTGRVAFDIEDVLEPGEDLQGAVHIKDEL